jgi:hypothetical protein
MTDRDNKPTEFSLMGIKGFTLSYVPELKEIIKWENTVGIYRINFFA